MTVPRKTTKAPPDWLAAAKRSEELARGEAEPKRSKRASEAGGDDSAERWARIRETAAALAPSLLGYTLWVDRMRVDSGSGLHAMDARWVQHFAAFYASGKFIDVGRFGVRAAKSDSVCTAIAGEVLLIQRSLAGSIVGVCPVMSANTSEAGDRFDTIKANLRACGFRDLSGSKAAVDPFSFKSSGGGSQKLIVELLDSQDHPVEFRVYPANEAGAAGFTGIAGFGDELDLWGKSTGANPASKVLRVLRSRYTTQPEAKLHLMSATYERDSEHAAMIARGNTPGQYVARIGRDGSAKDYAERMRLAETLRSDDTILTAGPLDPECPDIPCWATNPITPIEEAYAKADGDLRTMFALFGGRLDLVGASGGSQLTDIAARMRELRGDQPSAAGLRTFPGLPGWDPRSDRYVAPTGATSFMTRRRVM